MSILEVKDVNFIYGEGLPTQIKALDSINFSVEEGKFIGVIGHTGSGKSTLIQLFNGLLKPTSGTVLIDGHDLFASKEDLRKYRFKVGLVFQYPEYQLFEETVYKDIAFGPKNMGKTEDEIDKDVKDAMKFVGLPLEYLSKSPFELSGGQKRRVAIAGVIAMKPSILVLDEVTAGLDPLGREEILEQMKAYHEKTGATIIMVSHSMDDVARYADRVLVLNKGKIEKYGTTDEVFSDSNALTDIGLEIPEVTKIFCMLKDRGLDVPENIHSMDEAKKVLINLYKNRGGKS